MYTAIKLLCKECGTTGVRAFVLSDASARELPVLQHADGFSFLFAKSDEQVSHLPSDSAIPVEWYQLWVNWS